MTVRSFAAGEKVALYFGYGDGGHFLRYHEHESTLNPERDFIGLPWSIALMDTGLLANGKVPDQPDGKVYSTCGGRLLEPRGRDLWIAFYWWDRSGDKRPGSNSGFYVHGFEWEEKEKAFAYACECWPHIVTRQAFPLVLTELPRPPR